MEAKEAAVLLTQVITIFEETGPGPDKVRIADAVAALRDVIPKVLGNEKERKQFLGFVGLVKNRLSAAEAYVLSVELQEGAPRCLNDGTSVNCGGPPERYNPCNLCGLSGKG